MNPARIGLSAQSNDACLGRTCNHLHGLPLNIRRGYGRIPVDPNVINYQIRWIRRCRLRIAGPITSDCQIQHHIEGMVEYPSAAQRQVARVAYEEDVRWVFEIELDHT